MFEQDNLGDAVTMLSLSTPSTPASSSSSPSSSSSSSVVGCAAQSSSSSSDDADVDVTTASPDYVDDPLEVQIRTQSANLVAVDENPDFHFFPSTWQALYSLVTSGGRARHIANLALLDMPYAESEETSAADEKPCALSLITW